MSPDRWVCFDVNGTLLDPGSLARAWGPLGPAVEPLVFGALQDAVHASQVDTITGRFRALKDLLRMSLERRARLAGLDPAPAAEAVALLGEMAPYPEAAPALGALREAGLRLAAVTNSTAAGAEVGLGHAGLLDLLDEVVSVEELGRFKPHPDVYAHALERLGGAEAEATWFVAAHWWDVTGAKRQGFRTAWVGHEERELTGCSEPHDVEAEDLLGAARGILDAGPL